MARSLHEYTAIDHRSGRYLNADLSEYHVPVNADVRGLDVIQKRFPAGETGPVTALRLILCACSNAAPRTEPSSRSPER